jgi:hypothetical protein
MHRQLPGHRSLLPGLSALNFAVHTVTQKFVVGRRCSVVLLSEATRGAAQPLSAEVTRFVPAHLLTVFDAPSSEILTVRIRHRRKRRTAMAVMCSEMYSFRNDLVTLGPKSVPSKMEPEEIAHVHERFLRSMNMSTLELCVCMIYICAHACSSFSRQNRSSLLSLHSCKTCWQPCLSTHSRKASLKFGRYIVSHNYQHLVAV